MRLWKSVVVSCGAALAFFFGVDSLAQTTAPALFTVRAELVHKLRTGTLKTDDTFALKTTETWQRPGCTVPKETYITGHVASVGSAGAGHNVEVAVQFAPLACAGDDATLLTPLLIALQVHEEAGDSALQRMATAGDEQRTIASMFTPARPGVPTATDTLLTSNNAISTTNVAEVNHRDETELKTGEVAGMRGVTMQLPSTSMATVLRSRHEIVFSGDRTTFVLALVAITPKPQDRREDLASVAEGPPHGARHTRRTEQPDKLEPPEQALEGKESEFCAVSGCLQVSTPAGETRGNALWSLPLQAFGFKPRPEQQLSALDNSTSVHFLGEDEVLVTFPVHSLIRRSEGLEGDLRKIRAVLFSRQDGHVVLVKDWVVPDNVGAYLWNFGPNRLLAHVGNELVVFGADLLPQKRFPLPGPLLFVSAAPGGELALVATVHERHTPTEHARLQGLVGPGQTISESYDLTAFDADLNSIGSRTLFVQPVQPAIFQASMILARRTQAAHWDLDQTPWAGQRTVLASFKSDCSVQLSALAGGLLLARGCVPNQSDTTWFRVLNSHGATLLKGNQGSFNLFAQANTDASGKVFAIAFSDFKDRTDLQRGIRAGDFKSLELQAYSSHSGKVLFASHITPGSPELEPFSLSPSGGALAVLATDVLQLYTIAPESSAGRPSHP